MKLVTTEMTSLVERQSDDSHALGSLMEHILNTARRNIIAVKITLKTNLKQRKINSPLVNSDILCSPDGPLLRTWRTG